ncbi:hypothetical protein [Chitinophaga caseinilytica]|uniref:Uncharacterized protein n=1 Tax=Chitinophaga caseinilytica TaxID=2267521 RepID=A0ABZ2Z562_9BACT
MVKKVPDRLIIYTQDIENILGKSARSARKYMSRLRKIFQKERGQFISVEEFCAASGLTEEQVRIFIGRD